MRPDKRYSPLNLCSIVVRHQSVTASFLLYSKNIIVIRKIVDMSCM